MKHRILSLSLPLFLFAHNAQDVRKYCLSSCFYISSRLKKNNPLCLTMTYYKMLIALCCLAELVVFFTKIVVRQEYRIKSVETLSKVLIWIKTIQEAASSQCCSRFCSTKLRLALPIFKHLVLEHWFIVCFGFEFFGVKFLSGQMHFQVCAFYCKAFFFVLSIQQL